jgi:hypothetical protein
VRKATTIKDPSDNQIQCNVFEKKKNPLQKGAHDKQVG